uniref:Uncharacterized protein n=1 Tax=Anguilla anguilla TaxID=7936 RepID=A0A0E9T9R4_ANGAN
MELKNAILWGKRAFCYFSVSRLCPQGLLCLYSSLCLHKHDL